MAETKNGKMSRVKNILVSQDIPANALPPYTRLIEKFDLKIDFRPFVKVEPVNAKKFRKQKISILKYSAIIFTSRNAVDHFFRLCGELKVEMPTSMKYFCVSSQTSNYLQKYIVVRRRKVFTGLKSPRELTSLIKKHKSDKYLLPCSSIHKSQILDFLKKNSLDYSEAIMYDTVAAGLNDLVHTCYDIIAFFSPSSVDSLLLNFPDFEQKNTKIATFGTATAQAARDAGLVLDIEAPLPNAPSMAGALELYIKKVNGTA